MMQRTLLFLTILFYSFIVHLSYAQLDSGDAAALRAVRSWLRDAAPGAGPLFFSSWNFSYDPCSFEGVMCDVVDGRERVAALNLGLPSGSSAGLRGRLHPALGQLSQLVQLSISPGRVSGNIPSSLSQLKKLQNLGLSRNLITGNIPDSLGSLSQLTSLDLSFNRLSGTIPSSLASLPNLLTLGLAHNRLSGSIPASFANSPRLEQLDVHHNSLTGGIPSFPPTLTHLILANNHLTGNLNSLSGALPSLTFLDLSQNQLSGPIPPSLFSSPLSSLLLNRNLLSGDVSPPQLVTISTVDLSFNQLTGPISPFLAFVQNLFLNNNRFSGSVPQEFRDQLLSSSLQTLFLQHNYLTHFPLSPKDAGSVPLTASLCIQFNCMLPPIDSPCPRNAGNRRIRPSSQCSSV